MRPLLILPLIAALAAPLAAQQPGRRATVTPTLGFLASTPLFDHDVTTSGVGSNPGAVEYRSLDRLRVGEPVMAGIRLAVPLGGRWTAEAGGAYGRSNFELREEDTASEPGEPTLRGETITTGDASITTLALAIARAFPLGGATEAEAGFGGGVNLFRLSRPECGPIPPSRGFSGVECDGIVVPGEPRYAESYGIPSAVAHLALRRRLTGRIAVEGRGSYSLGRANTESFFVDLLPELDEYEAPKRVTVHVAQLSTGVSIGL